MSKKKTRRLTNLSDHQQLIVRDFLADCAEYGIALDRAVVALLIDQLGYKVIEPGKLVAKTTEVKSIFGDPDPFRLIEDEYGPDGDALRERVDAANSESTDEAGSSESPEGDAVGNVLQQDV
jgi:hypothetical protein